MKTLTQDLTGRSTMPAEAQCRSILADGSVLTVTATRRPRANRADVKCSAPGLAMFSERMQQVVRLARHTEGRFDSRDQVVISIDKQPKEHERDWELAVVLADRMVRGVCHGSGQLHANGWSDSWHTGRIQGHDLRNAPGHLELLLGGEAVEGERAMCLPHLGALLGHPDPSSAVSSSRAWFPLHSGGLNDSLCWVEVSVYPASNLDGDEEDTISAPGLDLASQLAVRKALAGARHFDGRGLGRWRTLVRFGQANFQGNSYELALVMADRIARGREFLPRGRLIASGCSSQWHAGRVDPVEGREPKCALIARLAQVGDRVLLPSAWEGELAADFVPALKRSGASLACIGRIGLI
jgi:hypothetical protein